MKLSEKIKADRENFRMKRIRNITLGPAEKISNPFAAISAGKNPILAVIDESTGEIAFNNSHCATNLLPGSPKDWPDEFLIETIQEIGAFIAADRLDHVDGDLLLTCLNKELARRVSA